MADSESFGRGTADSGGEGDRKRPMAKSRVNCYKKRSTVWQHFDLDRETSSAICHYCERQMNYNLKNGTTSNLLKHLTDHHMDHDSVRFRCQQNTAAYRTKKDKTVRKFEQDAEPPAYGEEEMVTVTPKRSFNCEDGAQVFIMNDTVTPDTPYQFEYVEETPSARSVAPPPAYVIQNKKRPAPARSGGVMDLINKRLDTIEKKVDLLLNFLIGDNYVADEPVEEPEEPPKRKRRATEDVFKGEVYEVDELSE